MPSKKRGVTEQVSSPAPQSSSSAHDKIDEEQKTLDSELAKKVAQSQRCGCAVDDLQHWVDDMTEKHKEKVKDSFNTWSLYIFVTATLVLLVSSFLGYLIVYSSSFQRSNDPVKYNDQVPDWRSYKWTYESSFFNKESVSLFRNLALNGEKLSTIVEDNGVEGAGENVRIGHPNCKHPFMTLNPQRTMCHFSNRLDVGIHYVKTGGFNGHIEYLDKMVARILPFRKRLIQQQPNAYNSYVNLKKLKEFNTERFHQTANSICADNNANLFDKKKLDSIVNDIFQLDILLMLPGQELPMHLNVPYFWGADRNQLPHWLLVLMKSSKLFEDIFIPQVQGVSWLDTEAVKPTDADDEDDSKHDENFTHESVQWDGEGGDFYLYPYVDPVADAKKQAEREDDKEAKEAEIREKNKYVILKRKYNSAIILDGAQVIHGVDRYRPHDLPPLFASNHHYTIRFDGYNKKWHLHDFQNTLLRSYYQDDVKLMVVWNMHCFANQSQKAEFHAHKRQPLSLQQIMQKFKEDLKKRNKLPSENIEPIDLWTVALKEYLNYPENNHNQNTTIFGFNYCLLPNIMPEWARYLFNKYFLNDRC